MGTPSGLVEGGEIRTWQARIMRTEGVVDETSRVVYAVAQVIDPYGVLGQSVQDELKVGTFVRAAIQGRALQDVVVLPRFALRDDDTVLIANADDQLEIRPVTVVRAEPRQVYIGAGVSDGERVVTTTLEAPITGTRLAISGAESSPPAGAAEARMAASAENAE